MNISDSIKYPFRFEFGSDKTHNPKNHKRISIRYLCRVQNSSDSFLLDQIRFICLDLHFSFSDINFTLCLKFNYINFITTINYLLYFYWIDQWFFDLTNFKTKLYTTFANNYQMDQKNYHSVSTYLHLYIFEDILFTKTIKIYFKFIKNITYKHLRAGIPLVIIYR